MAAPYATASSGLMLLLTSLPSKNSSSKRCIFGIRVEPPTCHNTTLVSLFCLRCFEKISRYEYLFTKYDFVYLTALELGVLERLLDRPERRLEQVDAELFEASPRYARVEVDAVVERVDLDVGLGGRAESALGSLARRAQASERALILRYVLVVLAAEFVDVEVDHAAVEVLAAEVCVARGALHLEQLALVNVQYGDVKCACVSLQIHITNFYL